MDKQAKILRCLVMDDEPLAREVICRYITRMPQLCIGAQCGNAIDALAILQQQPIDLLFADIQMPELLGTELIKILKNPPKIIITTAYAEYALQGYELDVVDYLLKPVQFERFVKAVQKVLREGSPKTVPATGDEKATDNSSQYLYFREGRKMVKLMLGDIVYVEGMKNYVKVITTTGRLVTKTSMNAIEAMLPEDMFVRVHRSYIISKQKIKSLTAETVEIANIEIPIGKLFKNNVMAVTGLRQ